MTLPPLTMTRLVNCFSQTLQSICTRLTDPPRLPLKIVRHVAYHSNFIIGSTVGFTDNCNLGGFTSHEILSATSQDTS